MISTLFNEFFYRPLYNVLIFISGLIPGHDLGLAIVVLTALVRVAIIPLSHKATTTQKKLKELEPTITTIREQHKANPEEQSKRLLELYREHGINPFSSIGLLFLQLPLFIALYMVAGDGLVSAQTVAYSFVSVPEGINPFFLGFLDVMKPNLFLALFAGVTAFFQAKLSLPPSLAPAPTEKPSFKDEFTRSMGLQARYVFPALLFFISLKLGAAVVLYIVTTNIFSIGHEVYVRHVGKKLTTNG